jgi:hypothetical protein
MEYPEASIFYSIWGNNSPSDFYVCGTKDHDGVIASVDRTTLQLTSLHKTLDWEYHKIILKESPLRFVVSGRDPSYTYIGYTEFAPSSSPVNCFRWEQNTDPASLCVVDDNMLVANQVILASSWQNIVTLSSVIFGSSSPIPSSYHFTLGPLANRYCVQDISTIENNNRIYIAVVGYKIPGFVPSPREAWHGYVDGLSATSSMRTNNYYGSNTDRYEHYKVKHHNGETYTGGFYQDSNYEGVLFGTPLKIAPNCDHLGDSPNSRTSYHPLPISVTSYPGSQHDWETFQSYAYPTFSTDCLPFKGETPAPELVMPAENESEVTTFHDRITVKDIPMNTTYQIYNVVGQLISTGVTTPDISTASLNKGVYILRLETGKTFKFVK